MSVAGAYWRGTRTIKCAKNIWNGVSQEVATRRASAGRGQETGSSEAGKRARALYVFGGSAWHAFLLPNGMIIRNELEQFARGLQFHRDYDEVRTPLMMNKRLWEMSGHWDHYKDNMYFTQVDETEYALKPMNCPGHMLVYKTRAFLPRAHSHFRIWSGAPP